MSAVTIKTLGTNDANLPYQKSSVAVLPNGGMAFLVHDANMPSMGGGNSSSNQYLHVYYQAPNSNAAPVIQQYWLYCDTDHFRRGVASMTVDQSGNLHIAYLFLAGSSQQQSLRYRKLTWTGSAFTLGSEETIKAYTANKLIESVDIDIPGTQTVNPVVASCWRSNTNLTTQTSSVELSVRVGTTTWQQSAVGSISGYYPKQDVSICCRKTAETGNNSNFVIAWNPGPPPSGTADPGDFLYGGRLNTSTGVISGSIAAFSTGVNKGLNGGERTYHVYEVGRGVFLIHGHVQLNKSREFLYIVSTDPTVNTVTKVIEPRYVDSASAIYYRFDRKFTSAQWINNGANKGTLVVYSLTASGPWITTHEIDGSTGVWNITSTKQYKLFSTGTSIPTKPMAPYSGDRGRFSDYRHVAVVAPYTRANSQTIYQKVMLFKRAGTPGGLISSPTANQVVATSKPTVVVRVTGVGAEAGAIRSRIRLQVSNTNTFTAGVVDLTQALDAEAYYTTTPVNVSVSLANYPLTQGTWYVRAQVIDQFGGISPWSDSQVFVISHRPSPINTDPPNQQVLVYDPAGSVFKWQFSDSYADDSQTAYQIDVATSTDAGLTWTNIVTTTGKVASSSNSAVLVIPSSLLEQSVKWFLTVWDQDDVSSTAIDCGVVLLTVPPIPSVTYPVTDADTVTTPIPTVSWDPGISGTKIQTSVRIMIHRAVDDSLVYDSRDSSVIAATNSFTIPIGNLHNTTDYRLTISVTDSANLQTSVSRLFKTSWIVPDVRPAPQVFTDNHDTRGYTSIRVDPSGADADLISFQVYRRALDKAPDWELVSVVDATNELFTVRDYFCPAGVNVEYLVTQLADRFGDQVESQINLTPRTQVAITNAGYWLVDQTDSRLSMNLPNVTSDSLSTEYEESIYTVVNKGRVVEVGERLGVTGTLSAQIRHQEAGWFSHENYNLLANPNLESDGLGGFTGWNLVDDGALTPGLVTIAEQGDVFGPANRDKRLLFSIKKNSATSNQINTGLEQVITQSAYADFQNGAKYFASCWLAIPVSAPGYQVKLEVTWRTGTTVRGTENVIVGTDLTTLTLSNFVESRVEGNQLWLRLGRVITVPSNWAIDNVLLRLVVMSTGSAILQNLNLYVEGFTFTPGADPVAYFDGDTIGAQWTNQRLLDPAFNPGQLSARWMRARLELMKSSGHDVYLRNPFGDVWRVYIGTIAISRVAGVGTSEYVDVEVPYMEIGQ